MRSARPETHELSVGCYSLVQDSVVGCLYVQDPGSIPSTANKQANKIRCPGFSSQELQTGCCRNGQVACPASLRTGLRHTLLPTVSMAYCLAMQISDPQVQQFKPTAEMSSKLQMGLHSTPDREGSCWGGDGVEGTEDLPVLHSQAPTCHQRPTHNPGELMARKGV